MKSAFYLAAVAAVCAFGCMPDARSEAEQQTALAAARARAGDAGSLGELGQPRTDGGSEIGQLIETAQDAQVVAAAEETNDAEEAATAEQPEVVEEASAVEDALVAEDDATSDEESSVAEEVAVEDDGSASDDDSVTETEVEAETEVVDEVDIGAETTSSVVEEAIVVEETTVAEDAVIAEEATVAEEVAVVEETAVAEDIAAADDGSTPDDGAATPEVEVVSETVVVEEAVAETDSGSTDATADEVDTADIDTTFPELPPELPPPDLCAGKSCDDGNACTLDSCTKSTGVCAHAPTAGAACSDSNVCTEGDSCSAAGACVAGSAKSCTDGDACTSDSCDPKTGCAFAKNWVKYTYDPVAPLPDEWTKTESFQTNCSSYAKDNFKGQCGIGVKFLPPNVVEHAMLDLAKVRSLYKMTGTIRVTFGWANYTDPNLMTVQSWAILGSDGNILLPKNQYYDEFTGEGQWGVVEHKALAGAGVKLEFKQVTGKFGMKAGTNVWGPVLVHPTVCSPPSK